MSCIPRTSTTESIISSWRRPSQIDQQQGNPLPHLPQNPVGRPNLPAALVARPGEQLCPATMWCV